MPLPVFFVGAYEPGAGEFRLDEDNSRHIVLVLRMRPGEDILLTDGKGNLLTATIRMADKKKCLVLVKSAAILPPPAKKVSIAISPIKNSARFEWFLEKATEIGVGEIIPLLCERTERQQLRADRLHNILVSALLQSQQTWLPALRPPTAFSKLIAGRDAGRRLIARLDGSAPFVYPGPDPSPTLILIGPEGDFTPEEAEAAVKNGFTAVSLGKNRLRTETAGLVAATMLCIG